MNVRYLFLVLLVMTLGIIGWVTVYGLAVTVFLHLPGANALAPYRFSWYQGVMYILFGLASGFLVSWNAPERGLLHSSVSALLFGVLWFQADASRYCPYLLFMVCAAVLSGTVASWRRASA